MIKYTWVYPNFSNRQRNTVYFFVILFGVVLLQVCITGPAGSILRTDLFEWHVGWSAIIPEFQRHLGNRVLETSISFSEGRRNYRGPDQANKGGGGPQPCLLGAKNFCIAPGRSEPTGPPPFIVPSSERIRRFRRILSLTLQRRPLVMLFNRLFWRNNIMMNNVLPVKKHHEHALDIRMTCFSFF